MGRVTLLSALLIAAVSAGQPPELPQKGAGPGLALSPAEAQKFFKLDPGLRIELVACEPQIESPVAMAFDPQGRLWVVEMRDYPSGPAKGKPAQGRIRILEDKDGDGFFETATTYADGLLFANGLFFWKDGVIVTLAPNIAHLRDTDGDGKVDKTDVLYTGFTAQNPQLRVSHPNLGLDGWIYCANGLRGGKVVKAGDPTASPVDLSSMDFRFDPTTGAYEAITGPGQYGNTFDEWGNRFICDNRHHLRHVVMENRYVKRNPYLAAPALVEDVSVLDDGPLNSGGKVYPISKNWTTSSLHEGRFTAACGVFIYHGQLLTDPERKRREPRAPQSIYHGAAFTCEPTGNLVHMEVLTPRGATFSAKPARDKVEFLATTDDWFRPVFLTHGPEGAMYVVDMYRAVIEHPDFMPPELKNRPDLWKGREKGRIWRIVPKDHVTKTSRPNLDRATIPELVNTLAHAEPWWRSTAQRLLLEKNDKAMIGPLTSLLDGTKDPHAKILAAWMLHRNDSLNDKLLAALLGDANPRVREQAIRIVEPTLQNNPAARQRLMSLQGGDARVLFQQTLTLGGLDDENVATFLAQAAYSEANDPWTRLAIQSALPKHLASLFQRFVAMPLEPNKHKAMTRELAVLLGTQKNAEAYLHAFQAISDHSDALKWAGITGLAEGLHRRGATLRSVSKELRQTEQKTYEDRLDNVFAKAAKQAGDTKQPALDRELVIPILGQAPWPAARQALLPLITQEENVGLRIPALRALAAHQDKEVPALLVKLWPSSGPGVRREILEAMLRQPDRVHVLLDEIEGRRLKSSELDPLRTRQLLNSANVGIKTRARKLLANNLPADRQKVLAEYQPALTLKGDATKGRELFKKNCATCHRVAGIGIDVGPDIADTRTKTLGAMLNDIIAPNAAIDNNYVNYVVTTKDGRILTGLLATETGSSITLKRAEGQTDVVLRKDVEEIASTGISLMPEGLEKNLTVSEMADLLSFLKNWRYLDGSVPIGQ